MLSIFAGMLIIHWQHSGIIWQQPAAAERHFLNNARASKYKIRFFCLFPIRQLSSVYIFHISPAAQHENEKLADLLLLSTSYIKHLYGRWWWTQGDVKFLEHAKSNSRQIIDWYATTQMIFFLGFSVDNTINICLPANEFQDKSQVTCCSR